MIFTGVRFEFSTTKLESAEKKEGSNFMHGIHHSCRRLASVECGNGGDTDHRVYGWTLCVVGGESWPDIGDKKEKWKSVTDKVTFLGYLCPTTCRGKVDSQREASNAVNSKGI
jgi:hypothetical protein